MHTVISSAWGFVGPQNRKCISYSLFLTFLKFVRKEKSSLKDGLVYTKAAVFFF